MAVGNDRFKEEIAALTGRRLKSKKRELKFTLTLFIPKFLAPKEIQL
jgi:hypothetical protein